MTTEAPTPEQIRIARQISMLSDRIWGDNNIPDTQALEITRKLDDIYDRILETTEQSEIDNP
jgi:hypothetical protein